MVIDEVVAKLRLDGFKITPARLHILEILIKTKKPISAPEIIENFRKSEKSINKTTVYRELDFLMKQNFIREIEFGDGKKRYEPDTGHHHHLICLKCKRVEDIDLKTDLSEEEKLIEKNTGFKVDSHSLEFFGYCKKCQKINP